MVELRHWLQKFPGYSSASLRPASTDASFRRYFRLHIGEQSFIAMDAPPEKEDSQPFVRVAGYFEAMGLHATRVIEADLDQGFLLLSDLGEQEYLGRLRRDPVAVAGLYGDALAALALLQRRGAAYQSRLPPYDTDLLVQELTLFHDWLCGVHLAIEFSPADELAWRETCSVLTRNALEQPQVFVHLDFHSRNLMVVADNNPGILDFQDAVEGPWTYDLVSLLKDCYFTLPPGEVIRLASAFHARSAGSVSARPGLEQFIRDFELMGVQRHLKAAGIFARLCHRDGKSVYMGDVPRTLAYIDGIADRYPELGFLAELLRERVLPALAAKT